MAEVEEVQIPAMPGRPKAAARDLATGAVTQMTEVAIPLVVETAAEVVQAAIGVPTGIVAIEGHPEQNQAVAMETGLGVPPIIEEEEEVIDQ